MLEYIKYNSHSSEIYYNFVHLYFKFERMKQRNILLILGIILLAIVYRMIPMQTNFSPINAIFLFSGAVLARKYSNLLLVLGLVFLSDFILNNTVLRSFFDQEGIVWFSNYMIFNYVSFILIAAIGHLVKYNKVPTIIAGSLASSILFFFITNAGAWITDITGIYPNGFSGLMASLVAGLPFIQWTIISDLLFSGVLFGVYYLVHQYYFSNVQIEKA